MGMKKVKDFPVESPEEQKEQWETIIDFTTIRKGGVSGREIIAAINRSIAKEKKK